MKLSTLILVALAIVLGGSVYYLEFRRKPPTAASEESKPAFAFAAEEVTGIRLVRGGQTIAAEKRDGVWELTLPVETRADQDALGAIANSAAIARVSRRLPAAPDRLSAYGLASPEATLELQIKGGASHRIELGAKDYSGMWVYARVDGTKEVSLLPEGLLESADKEIENLRDRSLLSFSTWDASGFDLKNRSGEVRGSKQGPDWKLEKPEATGADSSAVSSLLSEISSAKMAAVVSDAADDFSKYGLSHPSVSLGIRLEKGRERTLEIGSKTGTKPNEQYYARDTSRKMVFKVDSSVVQKLEVGFADLRDKAVVHFEPTELRHVQMRNRYQTFEAERDAEGNWKVQSPADQKGKEVQSNRFLDPLQNARANKIFDSPPTEVLAKLTKPAAEIELTDKAGKKTKISISMASGDDVYVRTSAGASVYRVGKQTLEDLNFKLSDALR